MRRVSEAAVLGTGVIGASWATLFVSKGINVFASDPAPGAESRLREQVGRDLAVLSQAGLSGDVKLGDLHFCEDPREAAGNAQFVQENGPENPEVKISLFRHIESALADDTVVASSSSMLEISPIQECLDHPEHFILGHPFNPPHLIPLVEVVGGKFGGLWAVKKAMDFYTAVGRKPIHLIKEVKGHVGNRLQAALWKEAFHLVETGVVSIEEIDIALAHGPGLRWALLGAFLNLHLSGGEGGIRHTFEHLGVVIETLWKDAGEPADPAAAFDLIAKEMDRRMATMDLSLLVKERDRLLLALLCDKAGCVCIP